MIPYGHQSLDRSDIRSVVRVLKSDWLTQGPTVEKFEHALAKYCGAKYAMVFSSGTAALHCAYFAAGLKKGDEFITTPLTFAATANAGLYLGAKPIFADIDDQGNLYPSAVVKKINKKTRLIAVVDYAGQPAQLVEIKKIAREYKLVVVEDACHALGANYHGKKIGSLSDLTVFSFHPVKSITTGEGGAVLTNNAAYYQRLKIFRSHGITKESGSFKYRAHGDWYYEMQTLGFNYRLTDIQAALGVSQLKKLDRFIAERRKIAARYKQGLADLTAFLQLPIEAPHTNSSWHLFVVRLKDGVVKKKPLVIKKLKTAGIGTQVHYLPVYWHPYYRELGYRQGLCPLAESWYNSCFSLPIFPGLTVKTQKAIINQLQHILK